MKNILSAMLVLVMVFALTAVAGDKTVDLKVKGMTCDGCVKKVQTNLQKVDGVKTAKVDLEKAVATVTYDDSKSKVADLETAVKDAGFTVDKTNAKKANCCAAGCCGDKK